MESTIDSNYLFHMETINESSVVLAFSRFSALVYHGTLKYLRRLR